MSKIMAAVPNPIKLTRAAIGLGFEISELAATLAWRTTTALGNAALHVLRPSSDSGRADSPAPPPLATVPYGDPKASPPAFSEQPAGPLTPEEVPSQRLRRRKAS